MPTFFAEPRLAAIAVFLTGAAFALPARTFLAGAAFFTTVVAFDAVGFALAGFFVVVGDVFVVAFATTLDGGLEFYHMLSDEHLLRKAFIPLSQRQRS